MDYPYAVLALFAVLGGLYVGGAIVFSRLLAPRMREDAATHQPVECGVLPHGNARIRFKIGYYLFALVFMIFDVEALFLFPCVKVLATLDPVASGLPTFQVLLELLLFVGILFTGLIFAWKKKVLVWQ